MLSNLVLAMPNRTLPQQFTAHTHWWANHSMHILVSAGLAREILFDYPSLRHLTEATYLTHPNASIVGTGEGQMFSTSAAGLPTLYTYTRDKQRKMTTCKSQAPLYPMIPHAIEEALSYTGTDASGDIYEGDSHVITPTGIRGVEHCKRWITHDSHEDVKELCTWQPSGAAAPVGLLSNLTTLDFTLGVPPLDRFTEVQSECHQLGARPAVANNFTCERRVWIGAFNPGCNDSLTPDFDFPWVADGACRSHLEPHMEAPDYYRASLDTSTQTLEVNVFHDAACTSALESFSDPVGVCSNKRMQIGWKRYNCSANA
jgi:hypothetical protein